MLDIDYRVDIGAVTDITALIFTDTAKDADQAAWTIVSRFKVALLVDDKSS